MGQLNFAMNFFGTPDKLINGIGDEKISFGTLSFFPFMLEDSISWNTINLLMNYGAYSMTRTYSAYIGLYSLNGSILSLANSISGSTSVSISNVVHKGYLSMIATSATQNITPGNWWFGMLFSYSNYSGAGIIGGNAINPGNAFPGNFIEGRMTASTNALPVSYATSDLDITGADASFVPMIILSI